MYDSTDELSERRRGSLGKVAGKTAHVSTLTFGALDMSKNDLPPELVAKLGPDPKRHEVRHTHPTIPCFPMCGRAKGSGGWQGVWLFAAGENATTVGRRCKRKASTKELASWVRAQAAIAFPAKVPELPAGPYSSTCSGCRVMR